MNTILTEFMERKIRLLDTGDYEDFLKLADDGCSGWTHLARVKWQEKSFETWIKVYRRRDPRSLINEIIGYLLAHALNLPQPDHAAVMKIELDVLPPEVSAALSDIDKHRGYTFAWATTHAGTNKGVLLLNDPVARSVIMRELAHWQGLESMIAFDHWIMNVDRQIGGNVLQLDDRSFRMIDNGMCLGGSAWSSSSLFNPLKCCQVHYIDVLTSRFPRDMLNASTAHQCLVQAKYAHAQAFEHAKTELSYWLDEFIGDETEEMPVKQIKPQKTSDILMKFLYERAHDVHHFSNACEELLGAHEQLGRPS